MWCNEWPLLCDSLFIKQDPEILMFLWKRLSSHQRAETRIYSVGQNDLGKKRARGDGNEKQKMRRGQEMRGGEWWEECSRGASEGHRVLTQCLRGAERRETGFDGQCEAWSQRIHYTRWMWYNVHAGCYVTTLHQKNTFTSLVES